MRLLISKLLPLLSLSLVAGLMSCNEEIKTMSAIPVNSTQAGTSGSLTSSGTTGYIPQFNSSSDFVNSPLYVASGKVGIGTTTPVSNLEVSATTGSNGQLRLTTPQDVSAAGTVFMRYNDVNGPVAYTGFGGTANQFNIQNYKAGPMVFSTNSTERLRIDGTGNVGIGTASPGASFAVGTTLTPSFGAVAVNQSLLNDIPTQTSGNQATSMIISQPAPTANSTATFQGLMTDLSVPSSATVNYGSLIGSRNWTNYSGAGSINGIYGLYNQANHNSAATAGSVFGAFNVARNTSTGTVSTSFGSYSRSNNQSTGAMTIAYGAYADILNAGTMTTAYSLYSSFNNSGTITNAYGLYMTKTNTGTITNNYGIYQADSSTNVFTGSVGIGTAAPAYKLDVVGDINASGNVRASGVAITSDERLKTQIIPVQNSLEKILTLKGVNYYWKDQAKRGSALQLGVIAQDVEKVFPEVVLTDAKGSKSVLYTSLIAPLIESVKELWTKLTRVDSRVDALEKENLKLKQELGDLKRDVAALKKK